VLAAVLLGQGAAWAEVYRWVDDNGRVHFTDRPPLGEGEVIDVPAAPSTTAPRPAQVPDRQRLLQMYDKRRAEKRQARTEEASRQAKLQRDCRELAYTLRRYLSGGPLYEDRPEGRHYFTAAEKDAEMAQIRALLDEHCGGTPAELRPRDSGR
jgi:hypothetical protein